MVSPYSRTTHCFMRNRTHGLDFPPFFSAHRKSQPSLSVAFASFLAPALGRWTGTISHEAAFFGTGDPFA